jgi:3-methyladenine DNA glycosylase AlkD
MINTAAHFIERLYALQSDDELQKIQRYFKSGEGQYGHGDVFIGVKMGKLFALAKEFTNMPTDEIEKLLESDIHEARAGAMSIIDKRSRDKKTPEDVRKADFELYLRRHDRVNNWDLVDLGALNAIGNYLYDKPRQILYTLAVSDVIWERRTAMLGTTYFIRRNDLDDTFRIAEMLVNDKEDLIHKAVGWMLRFAGDKDHKRLLEFLDKRAATMPRAMLRAAIEKFPKVERDYYMKLKTT